MMRRMMMVTMIMRRRRMLPRLRILMMTLSRTPAKHTQIQTTAVDFCVVALDHVMCMSVFTKPQQTLFGVIDAEAISALAQDD